AGAAGVSAAGAGAGAGASWAEAIPANARAHAELIVTMLFITFLLYRLAMHASMNHCVTASRDAAERFAFFPPAKDFFSCIFLELL
ncbi:hypothetical protein, partial [uncultured Akkermansia sp.]